MTPGSELPRLTPSMMAEQRWARWRGAVYEVGNPAAFHYHLPLGVPVVGTRAKAAAPLASYVRVESDAAFDDATRTAGLAYRVGGGATTSTIRVGVLGPNLAEIRAGFLALTVAAARKVDRVCLVTDNADLAYFFAERWFPRNARTFSEADALGRVKTRFKALAVAHVRTSAIRQLDRESKKVLQAFLRETTRSP